jgi:hypothetical protein
VVATKCPEPNRYLRGVDPTTGEADIAGRLKRLGQLDDAAKECRKLTPWRNYLLRVQHAGFVSRALVASKNAIVNTSAAEGEWFSSTKRPEP